MKILTKTYFAISVLLFVASCMHEPEAAQSQFISQDSSFDRAVIRSAQEYYHGLDRKEMEEKRSFQYASFFINDLLHSGIIRVATGLSSTVLTGHFPGSTTGKAYQQRTYASLFSQTSI